MLKQIIVCFIFFASSLIVFADCEKDVHLKTIQYETLLTIHGDSFYIFNNSIATIHLVYEEKGSFEEIVISPSELLYVGKGEGSSGMSDLHPIFESEVFKVYSKEKLIYGCINNGKSGSNVADTNYYIPVLDLGTRFIKVAPLFKWCGNSLCEDQCVNVNVEED
ncbi:MAG TPA: hypothetical protein ENN58_04015 [bacterium]|nr:hypothetical protein [bacterium]